MAIAKTANVNVRIQENIKKQAEEILDMIGIPRATAIDLFYRQIILNKGIPFSLTIPQNIPVLEDMSIKDFNLMMTNGYTQAIQGESINVEEVLEELEKD